MMLTPWSIFNVLYTFSFGVYANRYIFDFFSWKVRIVFFRLIFLFVWNEHTICSVIRICLNLIHIYIYNELLVYLQLLLNWDMEFS